MIQMPLEKLFTKYQITLLQGSVTGITRSIINRLIGNNLTKTRRDLSEIFGMTSTKGVINMPVVMVMWSPFYNIQVFSGPEAFPFFYAFYKKSGIVAPPEKDFNFATQGLINIANGKDPEVQEFKTIYPLWNNGPTAKFREVFDLVPASTQVNFSQLQVAIDQSHRIVNEVRSE
jgi:hypothetical protein